MAVPCNNMRKRSLHSIGLYSVLLVTTATPVVMGQQQQYPVPSARRQVPYRHNARNPATTPPRGSTRPLLPRFRTVGPARDDNDNVVNPDREQHIIRLDSGLMTVDEEIHYHVLADAAVESPDEIFARLRRQQSSLQWEDELSDNLNGGGTNKEAWWRGWWRSSAVEKEDTHRSTGRLRKLQVEEKFTAPTDESSISSQSSETAAILSQSNETTLTQDFNVTADIEYNVSSSVSDSVFGNATNDTSSVVFTRSEQTNNTINGTATGNSTSLEEEEPPAVYQPLRIRAFLAEQEGGGEHLTSSQHEILLQQILKPALLSWSAALRVDPVVGNLTVDVEQLLDGVSCGPGRDSGLPSVTVPSTHLTLGIPDTDLIVYLQLGFVETNDTLAANTTAIADGDEREEDGSSDEAPQNNKNGQQEDTDDNIPPLGNLTLTPRRTCLGDYLAASSFCSSDQYDRPTAALLHICIGEDFFHPKSLRTNIMTVMHELGHALGFNAHSLAHFRRPDGSPVTPRDDEGNVPTELVECTGTHSARRFANVSLPANEILQFRNVRGGVRVAEVVTPSVVQVVRNHFDCQNLPGAELESGEDLPLSSVPGGEVSCLGDHWERRLFKYNLMNPVIDDLEFNPRISTLTLAFFADSGWYQVDLSRAALAASWGRGAGCAFVEENCISDDGQVPPSYEPFFCNEAPRIDSGGFATDISGCTPDLTRKASCSIGQYVSELPREYQYFNGTYGANVGGNDPFMDYCPVFTGFSNGLCSNRDNEALIQVNRMERFGRRNSRCLSGHDAKTGRTALCLPIACVVEDQSFRIQIDGAWRICSDKDEELTSRSGDRIICPDPIRICPTFFCHRDCLGTKGRCDYSQGTCVCNATDTALSNETMAGLANPSAFENDCTEEPVDDEGNKIFFGPQKENDKLPEPDSPLSDYYVNDARALREESEVVLEPWHIALVGLGGVLMITLIIIYLLFRKKRAEEPSNDVDPGTDDSGGEAAVNYPSNPNPNKDKMVASVVVDLRMNDTNQRDVLLQRSSETDVSLTETEGSSGFAPTIADLSEDVDISPRASDEMNEQNIEVLMSTSTVRRRNVH